MANLEEMNDFIDRYLTGKLSLWELAEIEKKIKTDESFAAEVSLQRDMLIGISQGRRFELKKRLTEAEKEPKVFRMQIDRSALIRYAIAACITIFVVSSVLYENISDALTPNSKRAHYSLTIE